MHRYTQQLRGEALGRFDSMLAALSHDPAMLLGRDAAANRKSLPCEHVPREFMVRSCLGTGHFSESGRSRGPPGAFTGWFVLKGQVRFIPREHDPGVKRILGEQGNFNDSDVVRLLLQQPATPRRLVHKLYRLLISEADTPSDELVRPLAESFAAEYDIAALVGRMLRSNLFFSPAAYRRRIKSPLEFALGIVKGFEATVSAVRLGQDLAGLGQNLYEPPTADGWQGGRHWINSKRRHLGRANLAYALLASEKPYDGKLDPLAIFQKHGHPAVESAGRFLLDLFLQGDVDAGARQFVLKQGRTEDAVWRRLAMVSSNGPPRGGAAGVPISLRSFSGERKMSPTRRDFLKASLGATALASLWPGPKSPCVRRRPTAAAARTIRSWSSSSLPAATTG